MFLLSFFNISKSIPSFNGVGNSWDILIFIFVALFMFVLSFALGRMKLIFMLIASYITVTLADFLFPILDSSLQFLSLPVFVKSILFIGIAAVLWFLTQSALVYTLGDCSNGGTLRDWWRAALFGFIFAGFLLTIVFSYISTEQLEIFSPLVRSLFGSARAQIFWILSPLLLMLFLHKREYEKTNK